MSASRSVGWVTVILALLALSGGCVLHGPERGGVGPLPPVAEPDRPAGAAALAFAFEVTPAATATAHATVRAAASSAAVVVFRLLSLDPRAAEQPVRVTEHRVAVPPDGRVVASFAGLPLLTTVAQVEASNADIDGFTSFHGARDLVVGPNIITVNPTGSGMRHDLVAHVLEHAAFTPTLLARLPASAAAVALELVGGLDRRSPTVQQDALQAWAGRLQTPQWALTAAAIRAAQQQRLATLTPAANPDAFWTPGDTTVTRTSPQADAARWCGWIGPDEFAAAGNVSTTASMTLPRKLDWRNRQGRNWLPPVRHQYPYPTSVGFAGCAALEAMMQIQAGLAPIELSAWDLFAKTAGSDAAAFARGGGLLAAVGALVTPGVLAAADGPYHLIPRPPLPSATAVRYRAARWRAVRGAAAIKSALQMGPVLGGMRVYEDFLRYTGGVYWHAAGQAVGHHAILLVGYDDDRDCWIACNSWSAGWGEAGCFRIRQAEIEPVGLSLDFAFSQPAPAVPTAVAAVGGDREVVVSWPPVASATGYTVYWSPEPGVARAQGVRVVGVSSPWRHVALTNERPYYYVVTARNQTGESPPSAEAVATPSANNTVPRQLTAVAGDRRVTVSWSSPVMPATSYNLYYANLSTNVLAGSRVAGATSPCTLTGLINGVPIQVAVTAVIGGVESAPTPVASATPWLPAPGGVAAVAGHRQVRVSWNPVPGAAGYHLYCGTASGVTRANSTKLSNVTSPYTHEGVPNGTLLHYAVAAFTGVAESGLSSEVSARPTIVPPVGILAVTSAGAVQLTWDAVDGAVGYHLYWATGTAVPPRDAAHRLPGVTSPYFHLGAVSGATMSYLVTAFDGGGESAPSPVARVFFTAPALASVVAVDARTLEVTFTQPMNAADATNAANYTLSGSGLGTLAVHPVTVTAVSTSRYRLRWTAGEMLLGGVLSLAVDPAVRDAIGNPVGTASVWPVSGSVSGEGPVVTAVRVADGLHVDVTFSEPMDATDVLEAANYTISGTGRGTLASVPASVALLGGSQVRLTWWSGEMQAGGDVTVTVAAGMRDLVGNPMGATRSGTHAGGGIGGGVPTVIVERAAGQANPTNAGSVLFSVIFTEPVIGFGPAGVRLSGTASPSSVAVRAVAPLDGTRFELTVTGMTRDGTVAASVASGAARDAAGNGNLPSTGADAGFVRDTVGAAVTSLTVVDGRHLDVNFSDPIDPQDGVIPAFYTLGGTGRGTLAANPQTAVAIGSASWRLTWSSGEMKNGGDLTVAVASLVRDTIGNPMGSPRTVNRAGAGTGGVPPGVTIDQKAGQPDPLGGAVVEFTAVFSEPVTGFTGADVTLAGSAGATTAVVTEVAPFDGTTYNVAVTGMTSEGTVTASIGAGGCTDLAGNPNQASTSTDNTVTRQELGASVAAVAVTAIRQIEVEFDRAMNAGDVVWPPYYAVSGVGRGTLPATPDAVAPVAGNRYRLSWTTGEMLGGGDVTVTVATSVRDLSGNPMRPARSGTHVAGGLGVSPTVTVNRKTGQPSPAALPVYFTAVFSEPVVGLAEADVLLVGSAAPGLAAVSEITPFDGTTWEIAVSSTTMGGSLSARLPAGCVTDLVGNPNLPSTGTVPSVIVDLVKPTVTAVSVLEGRKIRVAFSRLMNSADALAAANYAVSGTGRGSLATSPSSVTLAFGSTYDLSWAGGEMRQGGDVTVTVASETHSSLGHTMGEPRARTHTGGGIGVRPTVSVVRAPGQPAGTRVLPAFFEVVFSEPVVGFTVEDLVPGGSTGAVIASFSETAPGDGTRFRIGMDNATQDGSLWPQVGASVAVDLAGNPNLAAGSWQTVSFDHVSPTFSELKVCSWSSLSLMLSEPVSSSCCVSENFTVVGSGLGSLTAHPDWVGCYGAEVQLYWYDPFLPQGDFEVSVATGTVFDVAGNVLDGTLTRTASMPPHVVEVKIVSLRSVSVRFSCAMDASALNPEFYYIGNDGRGTLSDDPDTVTYTGSNTYRLAWSAGAMLTDAWVDIGVDGDIRTVDGSSLGFWNGSGRGASVMTPDAGSIPRVEIACVPVGDPGNAADPAAWSPWDPACGAVTEVYEIGRYEVTNEEYCAFLNAKATGADPYGLFSSGMQPDPTHPELRGGIIRNGWSGNYTYEVATDFANKPVNHISYWDAVRFVNWLHNGATTGADTEDGAYTITGGGPDWGTIGSRNAGARYFLPTESEWHKAAYYKGGGLDAGYWTYPTCSDSEPTVAAAFSNGDVSNPGPNVVNYLLGADWAMQDGHVTSVGSAGEASAGPYGTFDQGGNVYEWTERHGGGSSSIRGGCWSDGASWLSQSGRGDFSGDVWFPESARFGLRVARRVAEP